MKHTPVGNANSAGRSAPKKRLDSTGRSKTRRDGGRGLTSGADMVVHSVNSLRDCESGLLALNSAAEDAFAARGIHLTDESQRTTDIAARAKPATGLMIESRAHTQGMVGC